MSNLNENDIAEYTKAKTLKPLIKNDGLPEKLTLRNDNVSPTTTLAIMINNKQDKLIELEKAINKELELELTFLHKSNDWRLSPDEIKELEELTKLPTEKQVNAFIENHLNRDYDAWKIAKSNTSLIRQQLDLINDRISLEKYAIKLQIME